MAMLPTMSKFVCSKRERPYVILLCPMQTGFSFDGHGGNSVAEADEDSQRRKKRIQMSRDGLTTNPRRRSLCFGEKKMKGRRRLSDPKN